jgi:ribosomal protein S30
MKNIKLKTKTRSNTSTHVRKEEKKMLPKYRNMNQNNKRVLRIIDHDFPSYMPLTEEIIERESEKH